MPAKKKTSKTESKGSEEKQTKSTGSKIKDFIDGFTDSKSFKMVKNLAFVEFKNQIHEKIDNFKQKILSRIEFLILLSLGSIYLINGIIKLLATTTQVPIYFFEIGFGFLAILIAFIVKKN